jgi:monolysocardiolipin acyltransferase
VLPLRWGVAKLIYDAPVRPIVLPIHHIGMDRVMPNSKPKFPRIMQRVLVNIGEPIELGSIIDRHRAQPGTASAAHIEITLAIERRMRELQHESEQIFDTMR